MTRLVRTRLQTSDKVELAAASLATQGERGSTTILSRIFGVSRPTVYEVQETAEAVLTHHFMGTDRNVIMVPVDEALLRRAMVALRVMSPTGIRPIEEILPILYPTVRTPSYGTIHGILAEAEKNAGIFNHGVSLVDLDTSALDEMFSQGDPILSGIDLKSGYTFLLSLSDSRSGDDWEEALRKCADQDLSLRVVVKDAAQGIAAGVRQTFPDAEQRDDCFHAHYEMGKRRLILERRAYATMAKQFEKQKDLDDARCADEPDVQKLEEEYLKACEQCAEALERHDTFECAMREIQDAMEFVDLQTGHIRTASEMRLAIEKAAEKIRSMACKKCRKVGTYIFNRAPGLALYMDELAKKFDQLAMKYGQKPMQLAAMIHRLVEDLKHGRRPWEHSQNKVLLIGAFQQLRQMIKQNTDALLDAIGNMLKERFRASSAIEGLHAGLRPHVYTHKSVSQGFLDLFRAYSNLKTRRWGDRKGTSAYEMLSGNRVADWLTMLGFPPSQQPVLH